MAGPDQAPGQVLPSCAELRALTQLAQVMQGDVVRSMRGDGKLGGALGTALKLSALGRRGGWVCCITPENNEGRGPRALPW